MIIKIKLINYLRPFCLLYDSKTFSKRETTVIGPTPPGTGVMAFTTFENGRKINIAEQNAINFGNTDIDDDLAFSNKTFLDEFRIARCNNNNISISHFALQIFCLAMTDGHRRIPVQKSEDSRLTDEKRSADDRHFFAEKRNFVKIQQ